MQSIFRFIKYRKVKSPVRANSTDSGIDFFIPEDLTEVKHTPIFNGGDGDFMIKVKDKKIMIPPHCGILIPSGIKGIIAPGFDLVFQDKSGVCVKKGLIIGAKVVDASYRGEIHLHVINHSNTDKLVELGEKIAQGILRKVELYEPQEISLEEFQIQENTERGNGGFGSTGSK